MKSFIKLTCVSAVFVSMQASAAQPNWAEKASDFVGRGFSFVGALFVPGYHAHPKAPKQKAPAPQQQQQAPAPQR